MKTPPGMLTEAQSKMGGGGGGGDVFVVAGLALVVGTDVGVMGPAVVVGNVVTLDVVIDGVVVVGAHTAADLKVADHVEKGPAVTMKAVGGCRVSAVVSHSTVRSKVLLALAS